MTDTAFQKPNPAFWPPGGKSAPTNQWQASNRALARLLSNHRRKLNQAVVMAEQIRSGIEELRPAMETLCRRTCRFCPEPCCITNTVWIDFRDLLLLHLLDKPVPSRLPAAEPGDACRFLSHRGCRLPWQIRPWMCIKYICPAQRAILKRKERPDGAALVGRIDEIESKRIRMEAQVISRIRPKKQTSPSSFSACSR